MLTTLKEQDVEFTFDVKYHRNIPHIAINQVLTYFNKNIRATKYKKEFAIYNELAKLRLDNNPTKYVAPNDVLNLVEMFTSVKAKHLVQPFAYLFHQKFKEYIGINALHLNDVQRVEAKLEEPLAGTSGTTIYTQLKQQQAHYKAELERISTAIDVVNSLKQ